MIICATLSAQIEFNFFGISCPINPVRMFWLSRFATGKKFHTLFFSFPKASLTMTTTPPQKLWVLLKSNDSAVVNHPTQVPTKDCENVDDFIKAIKKELSPKLDAIAVDNITLHITKDSPALEPDDPLPAQNTKQTALVVAVPPPAAPSSGPLM